MVMIVDDHWLNVKVFVDLVYVDDVFVVEKGRSIVLAELMQESFLDVFHVFV